MSKPDADPDLAAYRKQMMVPSRRIRKWKVGVPLDRGNLVGELKIPSEVGSIVVVIEIGCAGQFSPRNSHLCRRLNAAGFATLLIDLLTSKESKQDELSGEYHFDIELLTDRVNAVLSWLKKQKAFSGFRIGILASSTAVAASLAAAAERPDVVSAVVSRSGRPDLARNVLPAVQCPTLLIVGGLDDILVELNRQSFRHLRAQRHLEMVPGAEHLFEDPQLFEQVSMSSLAWFKDHLLWVEQRRQRRKAIK